jgi:hypothetical protein
MIESPVVVTFETLLASIAKLEHSDKHKLWEYLDAELFDDDDDFNEMDEQTIADIQVARAEYAAGDYLTYDQYLAQRGQQAA